MATLLEPQDIFFTAFQPKQQHRFFMTIDGIQAFTIKAAARPTIAINPITLEHINLKRYVAGKAEWQPITITLYDPVVPSAAQSVMEWVRLHHESVTGRDGYADFYKKDVNIEILGPVGDVVEQWDLKGTWIINANFQTLDWGSDDTLNIELELRFDYAILQF